MNEEPSSNNNVIVTFILVNFNTKVMTERAVRSILKHIESTLYEVVVIDNNSSDNSFEYLTDSFKENPQVKIIDNGANVGFGRASNAGIKKATGEYIYLLNPDAHLKNDTVKYFLDFIEKNKDKKIGALGSFLLNDDGTEQYSHGTFGIVSNDIIRRFRELFIYDFFTPSFRNKIKNFLNKKSTNKKVFPMNVQYILGANLFIPKYVLDDVGAFDPDYFVYTEETDLQYRMMKKGYERILIEEPIVLHDNPRLIDEKPSNTQRIMLHVGRLTFVKKHYPLLISKIYKAIMILIILLEIPAHFINRKYTLAENLKFLKLYIKELFLENK